MTVVADSTPVLPAVHEFLTRTRSLLIDGESGAGAAANDSIYGLAAGIWTNGISKAHRTAQQLKAGSVWIDQDNGFDTAKPFGGEKQSGWGRELGQSAIDLYTQIKAVKVAL